MDKTYTQAKDILDRILRNIDEWLDDGYGSRSTDRRRAQARVIEAAVAKSLAVQLAMVTSLLKTIALNNNGGIVGSIALIHALNQVAAISCVQ